MEPFISPGDCIGPTACSSRESKRPSHICSLLKAALTMEGVERFRTVMPFPIAVGWPSDHPRAGLWQVAQLIQLEPDSLGSKKSISPNLTRLGVSLLFAGTGTVLEKQMTSSCGRSLSAHKRVCKTGGSW